VPGFPRVREAYDLAIVGGGHAGLQATLKAALLNQTAVLIDRGPKFGRSYYSPRMDNIPGFPEGISGHKLLDHQIAALTPWDAKVTYVTPALATAVRRVEGGYEVAYHWLNQDRTVRGRALVLAQGVVDRMPEVDGKIDPIFPWANFGIVDFCIFCDGHLLPGKTVGVLGADAFGVRTALDLLHFEPKSVELLTQGQPLLAGSPPEERDHLRGELERRAVHVLETPIVGFDGIHDKRWIVKFADGTHKEYDKGFSALGWYDMHQSLARSLGAQFDPDGYVTTDEDCRVLAEVDGAVIPGLYCVGDLRNGWNQIPEAWATAERAVIHAYSYHL
jgi:thioredoxin reductase (NADPH)